MNRPATLTGLTGLTAADVAGLWRVPRGTVYRHAHTDRWRRYTDAGRCYYHPDDVVATFDRLAAGSAATPLSRNPDSD